MDHYHHIPVLSKEAIAFLNVNKCKTIVDCTLGGGGHTENILASIRPSPSNKVRVIGIDMDREALEAAKKRLKQFKNIEYVNDNFNNLGKIVKKPVDGILFDLGVSSYQIDEPSRGFSFQKDGPLDMRMDKEQALNAKDLINDSSPEELNQIFWEYGEERFSRRIVKAVMKERENREITTTFQLKEIIEKAIPTWRKRESVSRIFQALRIEVNGELENIKTALHAAVRLLNPGGRLVVIAYHSLEDRIVKHIFKKAQLEKSLKILTKKPLTPSADEIASNPRAKSAKLRAAEKI